MGHRADYVAIENGKAKAYYDHWGALGCTLAIDDGPSECKKLMTLGEATDELMDWAFAEAGFLLDYDEKRLIVFGYPDWDDDGSAEPDTADQYNAFLAALRKGKAALLTHVAPSWKGWTLEWNDRGVDAFADHLKKRGITSIKTQPASAPAGSRGRVVVTVDVTGKVTAKNAPSKNATAKKAPAKKKSTTKKKSAKKKR